jgi:hypothetical protein
MELRPAARMVMGKLILTRVTLLPVMHLLRPRMLLLQIAALVLPGRNWGLT